MATYNRKKQKKSLIYSIVLCVLVAGAIGYVAISSYINRNPLFKDQDFAKAIAKAITDNTEDENDELRPYELTQEMLDEYQTFVYGCDIGVDQNNKYASYANPYILLA
ncbi:MAG TPA: hypothetical protein DD733_06590, partial [Clostridiales bacterium]|nr:hypothetical protein [Clostridiales bacterium]